MQERSERELQARGTGASDHVDPSYPFDFHRVLEFVRHHRRSILGGSAVGVGLAFVFLLLAPPVFTAKTQVLLDPALPGVIQEESTAPTTMDSQKVETELAVLRSEEISLAAIEQLNLADDPEFDVRMWSDYLPAWAVSQARSERAERRRSQIVLAAFRNNLNVRRVGVSYAIDIFYTASDPEFASRIANGVAAAYVKFQINSRNEAARVGSKWLEGRLIELRSSMNSASRELQKHRASQDYSISSSRRTSGDAAAPQSLTFEDLESTAATYRRIYESFLGSYMAATQRQSFPISSAQIITRATPPLSQSRPQLLIASFAALLGAFCGGLVGELQERGKRRGTPADLAGAFSALAAWGRDLGLLRRRLDRSG